jgi:SAM-dependent methyltransferase
MTTRAEALYASGASAANDGALHESRAAIQRAYAEVPFLTSAWLPAAPERLAVKAHLHGLEPADPRRARVLEIGCGNGGNLLPLGVAYPDAELVGVDLAPGHIADAERAREQLELANVRLLAMSFEDLPASLGAFDYIVAHGIFSWIPEALQMRLLDVCHRHLAPQGVLFVSYNTFPGWHLKRAVRDMLLLHTRALPDLGERAAAARELLRALAGALPPDATSPHAGVVREVAAIAADPKRSHYFAHEYLEPDHHPLYFTEFLERCGGAGLRYLANADHGEHSLPNLDPASLAKLRAFGSDRVALEQALDYLAGRTFRQTLLCHAALKPADAPEVDRVQTLLASTALRADVPARELRGNATVEFSDEGSRRVSLGDGFIKTALGFLADAHPASLRVSELCELARGALAGVPIPHEPEELLPGLATALLRLYHADMVELRLGPPPFVPRAGERPEASRYARRDAAAGHARTATLRHTILPLDDPQLRALLVRMDGTRDRRALRHSLGWSPEQLEHGLDFIARSALLVR